MGGAQGGARRREGLAEFVPGAGFKWAGEWGEKGPQTAPQRTTFATDRPRRHRPQTAPQRARKNAAATDRPGTRSAARGLLIGKNAAATDRPAAQLLLFTTDSPRRHRPPRSATTAPQRARLADWQPPPQTAPQRNYFFLPQTAPAATDRPTTHAQKRRRHRPPRNALRGARFADWQKCNLRPGPCPPQE